MNWPERNGKQLDCGLLGSFQRTYFESMALRVYKRQAQHSDIENFLVY